MFPWSVIAKAGCPSAAAAATSSSILDAPIEHTVLAVRMSRNVLTH